MATMMRLTIASTYDAAEGIRSFELVHADGTDLPAFAPGAHVQVLVPNGATRKYSLCNDAAERHRYVITVKREANGQGGSMSLIDQAHEGDVLMVSAPDNAFPLVESASKFIFIAGGIGITPIISMIRTMGELPPAPWKLFYLTRTPESTAFRDELAASPFANNITIHHDEGDAVNALDLWPILENPSSGAHIYCCGPRGLMDAVRDMSGHWPHANVHFESFVEGGSVQSDDKPFAITLASTGKLIEIPVGQTILSALRDAGFEVPSSCESGTCGTCRTGLISGEVDHRDMVLMPEEMKDNIMICVSRAKAGELVLDL